jgi:hypothetical protein
MWQITITVKDIPELPPKAAELFVLYINISDGSLTHTLDSKRFYGFIRHCHSRRVQLTEESFLSLLLRTGGLEEQAIKLSNIYWHGRELLKVPCPTQ